MHKVLYGIRTLRTQNNIVYDITTSALSVYTNQYGILDVIPLKEATYHTQPVDVAAWAKNNEVTDPNLLDFENYSYQFFTKKFSQ